MLAKVLSAGEDEAGIEMAPVGDNVTRTKAALAQRTTGNLAALSGAHGLTYMEVQAEAHCSRSSYRPCVPEGSALGVADVPTALVACRRTTKHDTLWHAAASCIVSAFSLSYSASSPQLDSCCVSVCMQKSLRCNLRCGCMI